MDKETILSILKDKKEYLEKKFGVKKIGIFGSYIRGRQTEKSDIDIYVEFDIDKINLDKYYKLIEFLEDIFNKKIDIITKAGFETIRIQYIKDEIKRSIIYA
ncbi:MAG: nucleotidyltransferase family protein [Candidatus Helarchaeota archaeon]